MEIGNDDPSWPELLGANQWEGLLEPLSLPLRRLALRCGDLCQATYDAFDGDEHSKYCGSSRYSKRDLLRKVGFEYATDYEVSEFLYATSQVELPGGFILHSVSRESWSKESNWIGYVAVSSDSVARASGRREIYVVWRGTIRDLEWLDVLEAHPVSVEPLLATKEVVDDGGGAPKVMNGWYVIYTSSDPESPFNKKSARDQLLSRLRELVERYKEESLSIICTGHSLGASLAILSAFDVVENGLSKVGISSEFPVCAIVFGSPQVGNRAFDDKLKKLPNLEVLHVKNGMDLIPHYPSLLLGYVCTGTELVVDTRKSPYLKESKNPSDWHNLQAILHTLAGWNGEDGEFGFRVRRSVGLVNKSCDYLKDECLIPGSWWVEKNKGMVLGEDGEWRLAPHSDDDIPVPPILNNI